MFTAYILPHDQAYLALKYNFAALGLEPKVLVHNKKFLKQNYNIMNQCQAKFLTSVKFLTYDCLSVVLLLRVKELSLTITLLVVLCKLKYFG